MESRKRRGSWDRGKKHPKKNTSRKEKAGQNPKSEVRKSVQRGKGM